LVESVRMYVMRPTWPSPGTFTPSYSDCAVRIVRRVEKPSCCAASICSDEVMNGPGGREVVRLVSIAADAVADRRVDACR
jgi:hypothetical protein